MSTADQQLVSSSSGFYEFAVSVVTNFALGLISILVISFLRRRLTYFFDARRADHLRNPAYVKGSTYYERPPRQSPKFFGWITQTLNVPETVLLRSCGPDAVFTLRWMLRMGLYLTIYAIFALIIIVPIQASSASNNGTTGFNALSILSLDDGDSKLWCHLIFLYASSFVLFKLLHVTWLEVLDLKARWLSNEQLLGHKLTVFVTNLPKRYSTSASLYALFEELYPNQVSGAYVVQRNARLDELYDLRQDAVSRINNAKGSLELEEVKTAVKNAQRKEGDELIVVKRPLIKTKFFGGEKVDLITFYEGKVREYDAEIASLFEKINEKQYHTVSVQDGQKKGNQVNKKNKNGTKNDDTLSEVVTHDNSTQDSPNPVDLDPKEFKKAQKQKEIEKVFSPSCGFVTFNSAVTASSVVNVPVSDQLGLFNIEIAPEPVDVSWKGVYKSKTYKFVMTCIMHVIHFLLVAFWAVPVTLMSSILSVEALSAIFPWLEPVLTFSPIVQGILSGLLPSLGLIIFMSLLPKILNAMGHLKGLESHSKVAMYVFRKYFVFQLVNFFLVACISSTFMKEMQAIIENPGQIPSLLARGLPQSSLLFVNYIMMRAFYTNVFAILDVVDILLNLLKKWLAVTPSSKLGAIQPSQEKYEKNLPEAALILIICFTFGTIQPVILIFGAFYFFTLFFSKRYTMLWISVNPYQTGGGFWPLLFNRIMLGVVIGQLCVLGIFALKQQPAPAALVIPLILLSCWFWYKFCNLYKSTEHRLTLTSARFTDFAINSLTPEQQKALEGYDLPVGPASFALLPFVMTELFADTPSREKIMLKQGIIDRSETPSLSLYSSLIPQQIEVFSSTQAKHVNVSRDFVQLPQQFHGDDPTLDKNLKEWLKYHDTASYLPRQSLLNGLIPKKLHDKLTHQGDEQSALLAKHEKQNSSDSASSSSHSHKKGKFMTNAVDSDDARGVSSSSVSDQPEQSREHSKNNKKEQDIESGQRKNDSDDDNLSDEFDFHLPIEQKILLEQQLVRYQRSEQFKALIDAQQRKDASNQSTTHAKLDKHDDDDDESMRSDKKKNNASGENQETNTDVNLGGDDAQNETLQRTMSTVDQNTTKDQISEQISQLPGLTAEDMSSFCLEFTPFSTQQLETENMGVTARRSSVDLSAADYNNNNNTSQNNAKMVKALCSYTALPEINQLEAVMMRYFTPQTNPHHYAKVYDRVWGPTYLAYAQLKAAKPSKDKKQD